MVKDCKVLLHNEYVTVARFGKTDVQFPSIRKEAETVRVLYDGNYKIVADDYVEPTDTDQEANKKTTNKSAKA